MEIIRKILGRTHRLQQSLLFSPITVTIESSPSFGHDSRFSVALFVDMEESRYYFDSSMAADVMFQEWGKLHKDVNELLHAYAHFEVTSAGNIKK